MPDQTILWDTSETAAHIRLKSATLEKWRSQKSHALKYLKIGGRVYYTPQFVSEFLSAQTRNGDGSEKRPRRKRRANLGE